MTEIPQPWVDDRAMKPFSALVVPVSAAVDTSLVRTLVTAFEGHEFSVVESILGSGDRLQALIDDAASSFDVLVTIGGLRANGDPDIADILRTEIERTMQLLGVSSIAELEPRQVTQLQRLTPVAGVGAAASAPARRAAVSRAKA